MYLIQAPGGAVYFYVSGQWQDYELVRRTMAEKYEAAFRENEINDRVLPSLTAEDLKELGVAALGHRRMLLDAIAAVRTDGSGMPPSADIATTSSAPVSRRTRQAAHRAGERCLAPALCQN
jgi:hypothetical protein